MLHFKILIRRNLSEVIINSTLAIVSALAGGLIVFIIKLNHHRLCALISLSAGALFGAAVIGIIPEAIHVLTLLELAVAVISGYALFWIISKYYFHVCPACSASHFDEQTTKKFSEVSWLLFTALAFHSFFDGMAIATSGLHEHSHGGSSVFTAVMVHKFPEGLALASLMLGANYVKPVIIKNVILVELTTLLGGIAGYFLVKYNIGEYYFALIEAHIAGGFIYLSFHALFGEVFKNHKTLVLSSFIFGLAVIYGIQLVFH
jgi:ZIP family zinc transporter/zinc and cadmium transporter